MKFALPVAPNKLPEAPLPNEAPMSAPLPCWISTRPIITSAETICNATTRFNNRFISSNSKIRVRVPRLRGLAPSTGCAADDGEIARLQRGAANQAAVDVGLGEQARGVVGVDAAAVQDPHVDRVLGRSLQLRAQQRVHG